MAPVGRGQLFVPDPSTLDRVCELYRDYKINSTEAGEMLGCRQTLACRLMRENGVVVSKHRKHKYALRPSRVSMQTQQIVNLLNEGRTQVEIARHFHISRQRVGQIKEKAGM